MDGDRSSSSPGEGRTWADSFWTCLDISKYVTSTLGAFFCGFVVFHGIAFDLNVAEFGGPIAESVIFLLAMILLAANEGFQVAVLNSRSMTATLIREEGYQRAANVHEVMFGTPDNWISGNLKRLLIGQSFMVVFCSFTLAQLTTFPDYPNVLGMNDKAFNVLFCSGFPGVVLTIAVAQLTPSLLAKEYPLSFLNIPGIYHVILVALYLEKCGIMHFVYVLYGILNYLFFHNDSDDGSTKKLDQITVPSISDLEVVRGKDVKVSVAVDLSGDDSNSEGTGHSDHESSVAMITPKLKPEGKRNWESDVSDEEAPARSAFVTEMTSMDGKDKMTLLTTVILYLKYTLSTTMTALCFVFVFYCLATGHSLIQLSLPVQLLLLLLSMIIIIYCEGMKVSIVSTTHIESEDLKDTHRIAYKVHKLLNYETSEGVKKFLLGRQLTVVPLGFFIASLTHFNGLNEDSFPYGLYFVVVTAGLPGVMILLQVAQLTPQLLAEQNNIAFINLPGSYVLAKWALFVESFGIVNVTWLIYYALDKLLCKSSGGMSEDYDQLDTSAGNMFSLCYDSDSAEVSSSGAKGEEVTNLSKSNPLLTSNVSGLRGVEC